MKKQIKSFEEACEALGIQPNLPDVSMMLEIDQKAIIATAKLFIIIRALNEGWAPNWADGSERKYYVYFWMNSSGSGFSDSGCDFTRSHSGVGSRLCFKSAELAMYAAKQFEDLYRDYFLLPAA